MRFCARTRPRYVLPPGVFAYRNHEFAANMIYVDDEIKEGLGYHQLNLYVPVKIQGGNTGPLT